MAVDPQGQLFVGGTFTIIGGYTSANAATNIARWNGTRWFPLGSGINGQVRALTMAGNYLYAGGRFTLAGGVTATNIARWDGTNWSPVGAGILGTTVSALFASGNDLYVGGTFTNAGGLSAQNVAKWDGLNWSALGDGVRGIPGNPDSPPGVYTLIAWNNDIVAGGNFTNASGTLATNIAVWKGTGWQALGPGLPGPCHGLTVDTNETLYAGGGGNFTGPPYIFAHDGVTWTRLPAGQTGSHIPISVLFMHQGSLYAGGVYQRTIGGLARVSGTNLVQEFAPYYPVTGVVKHNQFFYFTGTRDDPAMPATYGVSRWDGTNWSLLGAGLVGPVRSLLVDDEGLLAGGHFGDMAFPIGNELIVRWDEQIWWPVGSGIRQGNCSGCAVLAMARYTNTLYAGGNFYNWFMHLNGTNWEYALGSPPGVVLAMKTNANHMYVGTTSGLYYDEGTNWIAVGGGIVGQVNAIEVDGEHVFAGGSFTNAGGTYAQNIAHWNGTQWLPLGDGVDAPVNALALSTSNLVVGGSFLNADSVVANCVALWDGNFWHALGSGFAGGVRPACLPGTAPTTVNALAVGEHGIIYAGGNFKIADNKPANSIAFWDGQRWRTLGSGVNCTVWALAIKGQDLFVGGDFVTAGGKVSARIALWHGAADHIPELAIRRSNTDVIVTWPSWGSNFVLKGATDLTSGPWSDVPSTTDQSRNISTNTIAGSSRFYRLERQ